MLHDLTCDVKQNRREREVEERKKKGIFHVKASFVRNICQKVIKKSSRMTMRDYSRQTAQYNNIIYCTSNGAIWLILGRVRLGSIWNKNNWNNATKHLFENILILEYPKRTRPNVPIYFHMQIFSAKSLYAKYHVQCTAGYCNGLVNLWYGTSFVCLF